MPRGFMTHQIGVHVAQDDWELMPIKHQHTAKPLFSIWDSSYTVLQALA